MSDRQRKEKLQEFVDWFKKHIKGYERGEGQLFFNQLLQSFGNAGILEVGAALEERVKKRKGTTGFADFVWKPRVIIELKERGTPLHKHYEQAFEYWLTLVPNRPRFMALCNFDEFWIYDLNTQLNDPVHILKTDNLANDWGALAFLLPKEEKPIFNNNNVEVTEAAAKIVGSMYFSLSKRKVDPAKAQRFVLQLVIALFSEDVGLIPKYTLHKILGEAVRNPVTQKELKSLFEAMATASGSKKPAKYKEIPYFNGGIFNEVDTVELNFKEIDMLYEASKQDWSKVRPSIFGSIFEASMDPKERHGHGIHYTSELDIQKIVNPTIVRPFRERIKKAKSKKDLSEILKDLRQFRVLDPACGSGNFLYISFRELRRLEVEVMALLAEKEKTSQMKMALVSPKNFYGIDTNGFGLELAKVALSIGRKLSADEFGVPDNILPFENLDENFINKDALFIQWPTTDAIIGNPPFQSKNKMQEELGRAYLNKLRDAYPKISGYADYCVYWFRKAHEVIKSGGRIGLVGTNTIRQNQSRESGLDYIVENGGVITEAVGTQVWSGDAAVHVSIVNWMKGKEAGKFRLYLQRGDHLESPWDVYELPKIPSTLSPKTDVTTALQIACNANSPVCFQGQTHGHKGFLLTPDEAASFEKKQKALNEVIYPFLIGDELVGNIGGKPKRFVIDFGDRSINEAMRFKALFSRIEEKVLPFREAKAKDEAKKNKEVLDKNPKAKVNKHSAVALKRWWLLRWSKMEMIEVISQVPRYIACARVTKRQIFEFVSSNIHPNDKVQIFALPDDYSFGIISSGLHWIWFVEKCTTLKGDFNYNAASVWNTFPWPQEPTIKQVRDVAAAAVQLRSLRRKIMAENKWSLRSLYRTIDLPGDNPLKTAHENLDKAVCAAYGFTFGSDYLSSLLALNRSVVAAEKVGKSVQEPGLPKCIKDPKPFISKDCIEAE